MHTTITQLRKADWDRMLRDVAEKLSLLRAVVKKAELGILGDRIANDLIMPALLHLGAFCETVTVDDAGDDGDDGPAPGTDGQTATPVSVLRELERKAAAFDAIASGEVYCKREYLSDGVWNVWCDGPGREVVRCETTDAVLNAIEAALKVGAP